MAREAELESRGYAAWVAAREANDWSKFAPVLREIVELKREIARRTRPDLPVYDALIDQFERGMAAERLGEVFDGLKRGLQPLLDRAKASEARQRQRAAGEFSQSAVDAALGPGDQWDTARQAALCRELCAKLQFDFARGRIDVSVHPFTGGTCPSDVRITTRYSTERPWEGITGTIHETGHALYEQGRLGGRFDGQPVSESLSMGIHESQSLLWERCVGQSRAFWRFAAPIVQRHFPHTADASSEQFYRALNAVDASNFIRVSADELTYPFHIIARFELERALMDGSLDVDELPAAWNAKYEQLLGVTPPDDKQGVLQDVHWPSGAFGYFPSYTLGAMCAVQLFDAARAEIPQLEELLAAGEFGELKRWLNRNVHARGSLYDSADRLMRAVTGERINPQRFVEYLHAKYDELYA